jgi:hypothetical protein
MSSLAGGGEFQPLLDSIAEKLGHEITTVGEPA